MSVKFTLEEGRFLTSVARQAIDTFLDKRRKIVAPPETPAKFREKYGVFVTLNKVMYGKEELRGCIGFPLADFPLIEAIIDAAISSATGDPRFPSVRSHELISIIIEVSVLTPPRLIEVDNPRNYIKEVKVGEDGLIIERGFHKGLLLPQVPVEWHWDVEEFLINCCLKAGLPPDAWLVKGTKIYKFSCIIVKEVYPDGPVKIVDMREGEEYM